MIKVVQSIRISFFSSLLLFFTLSALNLTEHLFAEVQTVSSRKNHIIESLGLVSVGIGPASLKHFFKDSSRDAGYHLSLRFDRDIDEEFAMLTESNLIFDEGGNAWINGGIGLRVLKGGSSVSGFLGATLGLGFIHSAEKTLSTSANRIGFVGGLSGGIQFFRNSDVHVEVTVNHLIAQKTFFTSYPRANSLTVSISVPSDYW